MNMDYVISKPIIVSSDVTEVEELLRLEYTDHVDYAGIHFCVNATVLLHGRQW